MNREEMNREIRAFFAKARMLGVEKQTMLGVLNRLEEVTKQRDELLAALEQFLDPEGNPPEDTGEWREALRVIAGVKGGAA